VPALLAANHLIDRVDHRSCFGSHQAAFPGLVRGGGAPRVTGAGGQPGVDDPGDLDVGAAAVRADEEPAGGDQLGAGGGLVEHPGADELTEGVGGAAQHRVVLPRPGVSDLVGLPATGGAHVSGDVTTGRLSRR